MGMKRHNKSKPWQPLGFPRGRHEGIYFRRLTFHERICFRRLTFHEGICFRLTFIDARLKSLKCRRASVQRYTQRSPLSTHFECISESKLGIKARVFKRDRHTLRFCQGFRVHGVRTGNKAHRIGFASVELPFCRVEHDEQPISVAHKGYSNLSCGTAHGAAFELVCLVGGCDCPRTDSDGLAVSRLGNRRSGKKNRGQKGKWRSHCSLLCRALSSVFRIPAGRSRGSLLGVRSRSCVATPSIDAWWLVRLWQSVVARRSAVI